MSAFQLVHNALLECFESKMCAWVHLFVCVCVCVGGVEAGELDCEIKQEWLGDHTASQRKKGGCGRGKKD